MNKLIPILLVTATACTGARGTVAFDTLRYPVSSSAFVYAPDGQPITIGPALQPVGQLDDSVRLWGIFYSWIPLSGTKDISEVINARIAAVGGEGVINLALHVSNCGINYIPFINWLPIYPGCTNVEITGTIVKLVGPPGPPPGPPPPTEAPPPEAPPSAMVPKGNAVTAQVLVLQTSH